MLLEESFADGRLLCRLVGLLERKTLSGIEWRAPSLAASRHNVTKVHTAIIFIANASRGLASAPSMLIFLLDVGNVRVEEETCHVVTDLVASCRCCES